MTGNILEGRAPMDIEWGEYARRDILARYRDWLPKDLVTAVRQKKIEDIFLILAPDEYQRHFDAYYSHFFAAPMAALLGPGKAISTCPAFVAPAVDNTRRKIYVKRSGATGFGTFYHEFIHYLQHFDFYPEFYCIGGRNPALLEGVTEYLTRAVRAEVRQDRARRGNYQAYFDEISSWVKGDRERLAAIMDLNFRGTRCDALEALGGVYPLKA